MHLKLRPEHPYDHRYVCNIPYANIAELLICSKHGSISYSLMQNMSAAGSNWTANAFIVQGRETLLESGIIRWMQKQSIQQRCIAHHCFLAAPLATRCTLSAITQGERSSRQHFDNFSRTFVSERRQDHTLSKAPEICKYRQ